MLSLLCGPTLTSIHDHWKNHSLDWTDFCWQIMSLLFNMLSRFVIAFLPRSKNTDGAMRYLNQNPGTVFTTRLDSTKYKWGHNSHDPPQHHRDCGESRRKQQCTWTAEALRMRSTGGERARTAPFPAESHACAVQEPNDLRQSLELVLCRILARSCK